MVGRKLLKLMACCLALQSTGLRSTVLADDWPQWMGPQRDNVWREEGILEEFPKEGLDVLWRTPIHGGYSGPAVAGERVVVMDYVKGSGKAVNNPGKRAVLQGKERVLCFSADQGKLLWKHEYECPYAISYPAGPRCTPTIDGDRVYTLGAEGNLKCLDLTTGEVQWSHDFKKDYGVEILIWGVASHPLVYEDLLLCVVGGEGSVAVAFDKRKGAEKWRALTAKEQGYCPPTLIHSAGVDQVLYWDSDHLSSLNPLTGSVYWSYPLASAFGMSIAAPVQSQDDLFVSAIGPVGGLFKLDQKKPGISPIWKVTTKSGVSCANSTPMIVDGVIYGADCKSGGLRAVDMKDASWLWETYKPTTGNHRAGHGNAFIIRHKNRYFLFSETGDLILANLSREKYEELGRFHVLEPTGEAFGRSVVWAAPAFARGNCYVRNDKEVVCVSLQAKK